MNIAEQYAFFRRRLDRVHEITENPAHPWSWFFAVAQECECELNSRRRMLSSSADTAIVSGQVYYDLPTDFLDGAQGVGDAVTLIQSGVVAATPKWRTEDELRSDYESFLDLDDATPLYWFYSTTTKQYGIVPPAASGTLRFHYWKSPAAIDPAAGIYDGEAIEATFTLSDATVTPGSLTTIASGQFTGDGTWQIGKGSLSSPPTVWRTITAVTTSGGYITSLEMDSAFDGATVTDSFIVAKLSPLSVLYPEPMAGRAVPYYALRELSAPPDGSGMSYSDLYNVAITSFGRSTPQLTQMRSSLGGALTRQ